MNKDREKERRRRPSARDRLLYSRTELADMCGFSVATIIRMENAGILTPIKPSGKLGGKTFYTASNVHTVVGVIEQEVA